MRLSANPSGIIAWALNRSSGTLESPTPSLPTLLPCFATVFVVPKLLSRTPIILAFAIACCFAACSHQADAGIIVDANGIVTEYTLDSDIGDLTAGTTINFFVGSYDDANAAHDLTNEPWVGATYVGSLGNDFRDELRAFTGAPALATDYAYIFATDDNDPYTLAGVLFLGEFATVPGFINCMSSDIKPHQLAVGCKLQSMSVCRKA